MSASLLNILDSLDTLAAYNGPWQKLRQEQAHLRMCLDELREREGRLDDVLAVAIVGGSGVGKSTLLNAIAGDEIAKTSAYRPCTSVPTVYHPPGTKLPFGDYPSVARSALEHLAIIDTPDSDTILLEHRERVTEVLRHCDLILLCGSAEKYLDEATWSLLRPLQGERSMVCVETKAQGEDAIRTHWQARLEEQGFQIAGYFRVQALRSLDRKLGGSESTPEELDFPKLEYFLGQELTKERIARIKRSNASGLLGKTVRQLHSRLMPSRELLAQTLSQTDQLSAELYAQSVALAEARLFREGHLWHLALGHEISLRAKGIVGGCIRTLELLRSLPTRMAGLLPRFSRGDVDTLKGAGVQHSLFEGDLNAIGEEAAAHYRARHSQVHLALARAGFAVQSDGGKEQALFRSTVLDGLRGVMHGPAHEAIAMRARLLCSWPSALLLDAPLIAFFAYATWIFTRDYFGHENIPMGYVQNSFIMFCIILIVELLAFSFVTRWMAWGARRAAMRSFKMAFAEGIQAFPRESAVLREALAALEKIEQLQGDLKEAGQSK